MSSNFTFGFSADIDDNDEDLAPGPSDTPVQSTRTSSQANQNVAQSTTTKASKHNVHDLVRNRPFWIYRTPVFDFIFLLTPDLT
jgi:hypothetical protein